VYLSYSQNLNQGNTESASSSCTRIHVSMCVEAFTMDKPSSYRKYIVFIYLYRNSSS